MSRWEPIRWRAQVSANQGVRLIGLAFWRLLRVASCGVEIAGMAVKDDERVVLMSMSRMEGGTASPVWMKAMVTAAAMVGLLVGQFITLPMVDYDLQVQGGARVRWSIMALGIYPIIQAFVLVELAAVLVPPWQRLREGGPGARGKLRRAVLILGLILAAGQALASALW